MTERERLIDILSTTIYPRIDADPTEVVADFLLDNGVIVPPVKVGNKVFIIDEYRNEEKQVCETKVFCIEKYADRLTTQLFPGRMAICVDDPWDSHAFVRRNTDEVYLTKEEAEAALKEREQTL